MLFGVGAPTINARDQTGSWAYAILPFVEQTSAFNDRRWTEGAKLYACPMRRSASAQPAENDEFGNYEGGGWRWGKTDYAANAQLAQGRPLVTSFGQITDGLSRTLMIGEKALNPQLYDSGSWYYDEPFFLGHTRGMIRNGNLIIKDGPSDLVGNNWGSAHLSGAQIAFCDGSVRLLVFGISPDIVLAFMTPRGGESASDF
jgi:prepilin-type processing-associated H-X9-DG protein